MKKIEKSRAACPAISPAGVRADRVGRWGIPIPDEESVSDEFHWRRTHQQ